MDIPIYDHMAPCLFIVSFDEDTGRQLVYSYPAEEWHTPFRSRVILEDPREITDFAVRFLQGKLRPTLRNENIDRTYLDFPALKPVMERSLMTRVNAE